jgi:copper(I)-binding protein
MPTAYRTAALALATALASAPLAAHEFTLGAITIDHPYTPATAAAARTAAGYMAITNAGATADRLVAVRSALPRTALHGTEVDAGGVARMNHLDAVELPPGETVEFAPQGLHVMFMGLDGALEPGAAIDATLVFENAGALEVQFVVEARDAAATPQHGAAHQ